jgi:predicted glycosyltransferase
MRFNVHFKIDGIEYLIPITDKEERKEILRVFNLDHLKFKNEYEKLFEKLKSHIKNNNLLRILN